MRLHWLVALVPLVACGPDESTGACKDSFVSGDLVITEVFADFAAPIAGSSGADDGKEWFEIYNNSDRPVSLKGVSVVHSKIDGSDGETHVMEDVTIAPGQFFTLGNATQDLLPAYIDYGYSADLGDLSNTTGGKLALKCGNQEIDVADYDAVKSGHSRQLTSQSPPDYTLNDDQVNWCEASDTEFETNNYGTPGADSDCAPVITGACSDNGVMREAIPPGVGELVITEFMPRPTDVSATVGQWVEVKALADIDLNGVTIDRANDTAGGDVIESAACIHLATGEYALLARSADMSMNGGLTAVGEFDFSINPANTPDLQLTINGTVIDAVTWTAATSARSKSLDPDFQTATGNDDPAAFCDGMATYGTADRGTPGEDNEQCPAVAPTGQCDEGGGSFRAIKTPAAGTLVITEVLANPAGTVSGVDAAEEWFEIKNTGGTDFDVNDLILKNSLTSTSTYPIKSVPCINVAAGAYALFAHSTTPATNGGLPAVDATFSFTLGNSTGAVEFYNGTVLLDSFSWPTATYARDGKSRQVKVENTNTTDNDIASAPMCSAAMPLQPCYFCDALDTQVYGTSANKGTPKAVNACM